MVTRFVELSLCTICLNRDNVERPTALVEDVTVGEVKRRVELCDEHKVDFMKLLVFLELWGEAPAGTPPRAVPDISPKPLTEAELDRKREAERVASIDARVSAELEASARAAFGCIYCEGTFPNRQRRARHVREDHRGYEQLRAAERVELGEAAHG